VFDEYSEILTIAQLAQMLQMSIGQIYNCTSKRGRMRMDHPLPVLRINGNVRFRKSDIIAWLEQVAAAVCKGYQDDRPSGIVESARKAVTVRWAKARKKDQ
jgi:predicted DNA-binding transcriptional regulator AlpA